MSWSDLGLPTNLLPPSRSAVSVSRVGIEHHGMGQDFGPATETVVNRRQIHTDKRSEVLAQDVHAHEEIVGRATETVVAKRVIHRDIPEEVVVSKRIIHREVPQEIRYRDVVHERVEHIPMTKMVAQTHMEQHQHREEFFVPETHVHEVSRNVAHREFVPQVVEANQMMYVTDFHYERVPVVKRIPVTKHVNMRRRVVERVPVTHWTEETHMVPQMVAHKNPDHLHVTKHVHNVPVTHHNHHVHHGHAHHVDAYGRPVGGHHHDVAVHHNSHHHHNVQHAHQEAHVHHDHGHHHHVQMVPVVKRVPHTHYVEKITFENKTVPEVTYVEQEHWAVRRRPHTRARTHREAAEVINATTHMHEVRDKVKHVQMRKEERFTNHSVPVTKMVPQHYNVEKIIRTVHQERIN